MYVSNYFRIISNVQRSQIKRTEPGLEQTELWDLGASTDPTEVDKQ